ncbi:hypothetical protein Dimus_030633 [Dionaea muscipula]
MSTPPPQRREKEDAADGATTAVVAQKDDVEATNVAKDVASPQKTKKRKLMKETVAARKEKGKDVTDAMAVIPMAEERQEKLAATKEGQRDAMASRCQLAPQFFTSAMVGLDSSIKL